MDLEGRGEPLRGGAHPAQKTAILFRAKHKDEQGTAPAVTPGCVGCRSAGEGALYGAKRRTATAHEFTCALSGWLDRRFAAEEPKRW